MNTINTAQLKRYGVILLTVLFALLIGVRIEWLNLQGAVMYFGVAAVTVIVSIIIEQIVNYQQQKQVLGRSSKLGDLDMNLEARTQNLIKKIETEFTDLSLPEHQLFILDLRHKQFRQVSGKGDYSFSQNHSLAFVMEQFGKSELNINDKLFENLPEVIALDTKLLLRNLGAQTVLALQYNKVICGFLVFTKELSSTQKERIAKLLTSTSLVVYQTLQINAMHQDNRSMIKADDKFTILTVRTVAVLTVLIFIYWTLHPVVLIYLKQERFIFDFGNIYGVMAIIGAVSAFRAAYQWKLQRNLSLALSFFGVGLLLQEFGQLSYATIYQIWGTATPYPSIGDIGFFGSIPAYIVAVIFLGRALGVSLRMHKFSSWLQAVIIPILFLALGYYLFLDGYQFDWVDPLKVFLDFGYPFFQAIYVSLAILIYSLTRDAGGLMRSNVRLIVLALVWQFLCDYTFLYQASRGIWEVNGINDLMYFVSYTLFTFILLRTASTRIVAK